MDRNSLELLLARGSSVAEIGRRFGKDPSTISYWMAKFGLRSVNREKHAARGAIPRERLEALVGARMTIAEIAVELDRSKGTVRHWLRSYGLRTHNSIGRRPRAIAQQARDGGQLTIRSACSHHGVTEFILEGRGYYRCKRCRSEGVARHRRKLKAILVREAGGRCVICGYDRHARALEFHHLDPRQKRLGMSSHGVTRSLEALRKEARKCVLLCANCHAEIEDGVAMLPLQ